MQTVSMIDNSDFPPEREILLDDLQVPMQPDTPNLFEVFLEIHKNHKDSVVYTLEGDAYTEYRSTHDLLVNDKLRSTNEDVQGILSEARGYCARITMVIHSLEQALENISQQPQSSQPQLWESRVSSKAIKAASAIIHSIKVLLTVTVNYLQIRFLCDMYHVRTHSYLPANYYNSNVHVHSRNMQ